MRGRPRLNALRSSWYSAGRLPRAAAPCDARGTHSPGCTLAAGRTVATAAGAPADRTEASPTPAYRGGEPSALAATLAHVEGDLAHGLPSLDTASALRALIARTSAPCAEAHWRDICALYFASIDRHVRADDLAAADAAHMQLSTLVSARFAHDCTLRDRAVSVRLLLAHARAGSDVHAAWIATRRLHPRISATETSPAVRTLLRSGALRDAMRIVQWHVRQHWAGWQPAPSRALLHHVMVQMRLVERILAVPLPLHRGSLPGALPAGAPRPNASGVLHATPTLVHEYADALAALGALLRDNCLPLVTPEKEDIAWLIKLLYRFDSLAAPWSAHLPHALRRHLRRASSTIGAVLPVYLRRLPSGAPCAAPLHAPCAQPERAAHFAPVLGAQAYNALIHYTLSCASNPRWCRRVLEHMTRIRRPPLAPNQVTMTILLRRATRTGVDALAAYALELGSHLGARGTPPWRAVPLVGGAPPLLSVARLLTHVDEAVAQDDTRRLLALLHHVMQRRLHTDRRSRVRAAGIVAVLYPELRSDADEPRPGAHHVEVYTAALQLAACAGNRALALRVWQLAKAASAAAAAPLPPAAATVLVQLLATETRTGVRRMGRARARRARAPAQQVRLVALEEYEWLRQHWLTGAQEPDGRFYVALLRLLRRTAPLAASDAALARVLSDIHTLGLAASPRLQAAIRQVE
ncbi:hypothetical protein MSPP1_002785 [Malassezia sp. CBS 17886]|nr:hypothetical protein MSPP1_002785 [Malassezia sp. CBS 17886]